jgi:uncharacterized membrane protein AbrB (regulator of aidB expression)
MRILSVVVFIISIVILTVWTTSKLWNTPPLSSDTQDLLGLADTALTVVEGFLLSAVYRKPKAEDQEKGAEPENEHFE